MTNIIAALIFIILSVLLVTSSTNFIRHTQQNSTLNISIVTEAKELKEFSAAAYSYSTSLGEALSPVSLTVSSLQSDGLLSNTFPQQTPFGQTFVADYTQDSCNPAVMDLIVKTTGGYNSDLLAKNGISGTLGLNYINSEVDDELNQLNISYPNANNPCVNGGASYYVGYTSPSSIKLNIYNGGSINTPVTSSNSDAEIYIYAPNQYGFLVVSGNVYGDGGMWGVFTSSIVSTVRSIGEWSFYSQGWAAACPVGVPTLTPGASFKNFNYSFAPFGDNLSQNLTYCIPIYKSQNLTISENSTEQILNPQYSSFYSNYSYGGTLSNIYDIGVGSGPLFQSDAYYVSPSSINGLNNYLYGIENYFQNYSGIAGASVSGNYIPNTDLSNNLVSFSGMPNIIGAVGFDLDINGNVYQFAAWNYYLFTGTGCTPPITTNAEGQSYRNGATIWADGYNLNSSSGSCPSDSYNLGTSDESFGVGYSVVVNPSNSSSVTGTITYVPSNNSSSQSENFTIPTPVIN